MKNQPKIVIENNTVFLTLDLKGLGLYEKGKAIHRFINNDTKIVEDYADTIIRGILRRNGINVYSNDKSVLKCLFDTLKRKGKRIEIIDFYKNANIDNCEILKTTDNKMTVLLEEDRYLECGVEIKEVDI